MDVSVVIPAYNRARLLPDTLDSVLSQTVAARDVIVVDDGSTDDTAAVAGRYAPRITTIRTGNAGSIVARNIGLRAARGRLVAFCDSDDLWRAEFLATMSRVWQAAPNTRAAYCDFALVRDGVWQARGKFADAPDDFWTGLRQVEAGIGVFDTPIVDRLLGFQPFFPSCLMADRAALIEAGGWDEGVGRTVGDDFGTVLRIAASPPVAVVSRALVGIRKHMGNYSADNRAVALGDSRVLEYVLRTRSSLASLHDAITRSIAERRAGALHLAFADRDFAAVREIHALLGKPHRSAGIRLKHGIASLPEPVRGMVAGLALRVSSMRERVAGPVAAAWRPGGIRSRA